MAMKIALFTAAFSSYPIERAFEAAAKYGYDGIEIGGFRPHARSEEHTSELQSRIDISYAVFCLKKKN